MMLGKGLRKLIHAAAEKGYSVVINPDCIEITSDTASELAGVGICIFGNGLAVRKDAGRDEVKTIRTQKNMRQVLDI
ncbi:hypothetical protein [Ewingella americana]|uniref:hypothetical protein n=1 Tax=Ewingella americana TaxID=41202 RepID=UPI000C2F84CC|nr:hypothetical protein [Ewingella americana]MRT05429.1 hypothetical protein [Ewingella americana]PKB88809.1 hypothetical protein A8A01_19050 [Ewingella americana]